MDGDDEEVLGTKPLLDFPIVGIGASAGGLEAVTEMFRDRDRHIKKQRLKQRRLVQNMRCQF